MAYEQITLDGNTRSLTHLELEIVVRTMIQAMTAQPFEGAEKVEADWTRGLELIDAGLIEIDFEPHFSGPKGKARLLDLVEQARVYVSKQGDVVAIAALNARIGSQINPENTVIDARIVDGAFDKIRSLAEV